MAMPGVLIVLAPGLGPRDRVLGPFLCYAAGLILGTVGPVVDTVWMGRRPLGDLGLRWEAANRHQPSHTSSG
jgi:hypothetical protein